MDAVGLVVHDSRIRKVVPPRASAKHLLTILRTLEQSEPGGETALAPIWNTLTGKLLPRRGMAILISDGFDDAVRVGRAIQQLRHRKQEVLFFHVLAPEELEFPFSRPTKFRNLEQPTEWIPTDARALRDEYLANFTKWRQTIRRMCEDSQADYVPLRTDEPVDRALGAFLARRQ
jgi:uncharacterized protein (DUF58 family)